MHHVCYTLLFLCYSLIFAQVCSNDIKTLHTLGYYYSQFFSLAENLTPDGFLRFSVRTPRDAHILLAPSHEADEPVYEIVLGAHNNTVNHIRGRCPCQEEPSATVRTVNLLSAKEFRNFWVRVKTNQLKTYVQVGLGDNNTPFHEWRDPRPLTPQYLSFRSATRAEWYYGYKDFNYNSGVSKDRRQSVVTSTGFGQYFELADIAHHSADGITLYFTVRSRKELQILLSPEVNTLGDMYLVCVHEDGTYLKKRLLGEVKVGFQQSNFLDEKERLRFWIRFAIDGTVMLGKNNSVNPLLQWQDPYPVSPQYVSFTLYQKTGNDDDLAAYADIQYGLGPDYTLFSQDCTPRWKASRYTLPIGAVRGGRNVETEFYVCRAQHEGDVIPGNYIIKDDRQGGCYISHNFTVHQKSEFEVLTGCNMKWVPTSLGDIPNGSVVAGYRKGKPKYYVIRVKHEGFQIIGKFQRGEQIAHVPYNGQELPFTNYEALVQDRKTDSTSISIDSRIPFPFLESTTRNTVNLRK